MTITMETNYSEIMQLFRKYPELEKILDICLPGEMTEQNASKTIFALGERNAYNAMISLNLILEELEAGKEIYFELSENAVMGMFLFHRHPGRPWCFVIPAGDFVTVDLFKSAGVPIAVELDKLGMNVAVWRHRTAAEVFGMEMLSAKMAGAGEIGAEVSEAEMSAEERAAADLKPACSGHAQEGLFASALMKDMGAAVFYMLQSFPDAEHYAVFGFSSGGVPAALWGTEKLGCAENGMPAPGAIVCAFAPLAEPFTSEASAKTAKPETVTASCLVTEKYPPTFLIHGELDEKVPIAHSEHMAQALKEKQVPFRFVRVADARHNFGKGFHTEADGWLADAVKFCEEYMAKQ
ncbi:MAG: prolyl oligopeptidase family serine peptidase [Lachnospiraceae bacterium]|nr:prolyl oligopeptidase family serine peptidase [Lachnospiraceae bacterium]